MSPDSAGCVCSVCYMLCMRNTVEGINIFFCRTGFATPSETLMTAILQSPANKFFRTPDTLIIGTNICFRNKYSWIATVFMIAITLLPDQINYDRQVGHQTSEVLKTSEVLSRRNLFGQVIDRISAEERQLQERFADEYLAYKKQTDTLIPLAFFKRLKR